MGEESIKGKNVLLVDDHNINRFVADTVLKGWGVKVTHAVDGKDCISKLETGKFDVILMDIKMPVMNGLQATEYIRNELKSQIPIVAMTANALQDENAQCLDIGMNGYISKPFDPDDLLAMIIKLTVKNRDVTLSKSEVDDDQVDDKLYSLSYLNSIFDNYDSMCEKVIEPFIKDTPKLLQEIRDCYTKEKIKDIQSIAHKLVASVYIFRIEKLYSLIRVIENETNKDYEFNKLGEDIQMLEDIMTKVISELSEL